MTDTPHDNDQKKEGDHILKKMLKMPPDHKPKPKPADERENKR